MERIINVKVSGNHLTKDGKNAGTRGEANATILRITFDEGWDGYAKSVVFLDAHGMNPTRRTLTTNLLENSAESTRIYLVPIPPSSLAVAGEMSFSVEGYIDGKRQRSVIGVLKVKDGIITDVIDDITPTQAEQLQAQYESIVQDIQQAAISRNEAEAFAENAKKSAESAEQTKGEVETLKRETLTEVDTNKNAALTEIAGVKDGAISAIDTNKQQALSEMSEYKEEALEDVDKLVEKATDLKNETLWYKQDTETSAQRSENHFNKAKEKADDASYFASKAEDAATRAKASADIAVLSAEQVEDYANRVIEVPEGETGTLSDLEEGAYFLKGKFYWYEDPDWHVENYSSEFENGVYAFVTKSEGEEDYEGENYYVYHTYIWYLSSTGAGFVRTDNAAAIASMDIIKVGERDDGEFYLHTFDGGRPHTVSLDNIVRKSDVQQEFDEFFENRLADEERRREVVPSIGVMADYVQAHIGELIEKLEPILLNEELEGILDGEIDLVALNEELETILEGVDE